MPVSKNAKAGHGIWLLLLGLTALGGDPALAAGIEVRHAELRQESGRYAVDAEIRFELSDEARRALEHGVPLHFVIEIEILLPRRWWYDARVAAQLLRYRLEREALSNNYLVIDTVSHSRRTFLTLDAVLKYIGTLAGRPVPLLDRFAAERPHRARIKAHLELESLPAPLLPLAYVSSGWRLSSPWHEWVISP